MSLPNTRMIIRTLIFGLSILATMHPGRAQSPWDQSPTSLPFEANVSSGERIGSEQVRRVKITIGTNEFAFVVPRGLNLRVDASQPGKLTISSLDSSYFVTVRLLRGTSQVSGEVDLTSAFRNIVLAQYEGASGLEESTLNADGNTGPAFEAEWYAAGKLRRIIRVAFIPTQVGTMEFSLVTDPLKSSEAKTALSALMMTLRSNKDGKIENLALTDKT
jgi:hypothetical protein